MKERAERLTNEQKDERYRQVTFLIVSDREDVVDASARRRMAERIDLVARTDDTGFAPGCLI